MRRFSFTLATAATLTATLLTACGGGGSSDNNPPRLGSGVNGGTPADYAGHYERPCTAASVNGSAVNVWQKNTLDLSVSGNGLTSVSRTEIYDDNACTSQVVTLLYPAYEVTLDGAVRLSTGDVVDRTTQTPTAPLQITSENLNSGKGQVDRTGNQVTVTVKSTVPATTLPAIQDPSGAALKALMQRNGNNLFLIRSAEGSNSYPTTLNGAQVWAKQ